MAWAKTTTTMYTKLENKTKPKNLMERFISRKLKVSIHVLTIGVVDFFFLKFQCRVSPFSGLVSMYLYTSEVDRGLGIWGDLGSSPWGSSRRPESCKQSLKRSELSVSCWKNLFQMDSEGILPCKLFPLPVAQNRTLSGLWNCWCSKCSVTKRIKISETKVVKEHLRNKVSGNVA